MFSTTFFPLAGGVGGAVARPFRLCHLDESYSLVNQEPAIIMYKSLTVIFYIY